MNQPAIPQTQLALNPEDPREREIMVIEREFALTQRKANVLASSNIVPQQYQNNLANCVIAMEMAHRLNAGELEVMQNLHVIQGRPSFSASYLIAQVNRSGILKGRLKFRMTGEVNTDSRGCTAWGIDAETGEELTGTEVTIEMAKDQGWWSKNGSKWPVMTEQMLQYRAAAFWSRINAPDATMGMHTHEEVQDIPEKEVQGELVSVSNITNMVKEKIASEQKDAPEGEDKPEAKTTKPAQDKSPPFETLLKQLLNTKTAEEAIAATKNHQLYRKLKKSERDELDARLENHKTAMEAFTK